jgi:SAM-dependent methyltransferase
MDDPRLDQSLHIEALQGLQALNRLSGSASSLWFEIRNIKPQPGNPTVRILDIASGSGDILIALAEFARHTKTNFEFVGADISPTAVSQATEIAQSKNVDVKFFELDVMRDDIPEGFDVVMTSLFTHHLDPDDVIKLLQRMKSSNTRYILVNDLVRSQISYSLVWLATRLCTRSPVVHFDGPVSVRASYTLDEMKNMALQAGLDGCQVSLLAPFRQQLFWKR